MELWDNFKDNISELKDELGITSKSIKKLSDYIILLGGASIVSYALRTKFLGKMIRAVEVPEGNMSTIIVRSNSLKALKEAIIKDQPPLYPGVELKGSDIQVSVFTSPHFGEKLKENSQCRSMEEGSYVLWTKMDLEIPNNGIDLRSFSKEAFVKMAADKAKDEAIQALTHDLVTPIKSVSLMVRLKEYITKRLSRKREGEEEEDSSLSSLASIIDPAASRPAVVVSSPFSLPREISDVSPLEKAEIVDILIDGSDSEIVSLCSRYKNDPSGFRWHAINLLRTRKRFTGKV